MLHEEHGGRGGEEKLFQLDAGKDIDKIQRFVPEEQVRRLTERGSQQHLLFLPFAVLFDPFFKLHSLQPQLPQYGPEKGAIQPPLSAKAESDPLSMEVSWEI